MAVDCSLNELPAAPDFHRLGQLAHFERDFMRSRRRAEQLHVGHHDGLEAAQRDGDGVDARVDRGHVEDAVALVTVVVTTPVRLFLTSTVAPGSSAAA